MSNWRGVLPVIGPIRLVLVFSLALVVFYNVAAWQALGGQVPVKGAYEVGFYISFFFFLWGVFAVLLTLVSFRPLLKPILTVLALSTTSATYFMNTYGVSIDKDMIQNVFETNPSEVKDLLSWQMAAYFLFLGVLPSILVWIWPVVYPPFLRGLGYRLGALLLLILGVFLCVYPFYSTYSPTFRNAEKVTHFITPTNYIYAVGRYAKTRLVPKEQLVVRPIGEDARLADAWKTREKPALVVLVVGETARADHFSLNGYQRETNPRLKQEDIINFGQVSSCGTSTAVSVPCMFSHFPREDYSDKKGKTNEGLLDVLQRAGVQVLWRENNSDCKGTCLRVPTEEMVPEAGNPFCDGKGDHCMDEFMLQGLQKYIDSLKGNTVIVLHSIGSHGPAYYQRFPKAFEKFSPICSTNQLGSCSKESLVNVYDNTILYTDHFLGELINLLKQNSQRFDTAMLYVSDHGESLGENGIYLHAYPYALAPEAQTHVPMVLWFSPDALARWGISRSCLNDKRDTELSHDNYFHSVLGLFEVQTSVYQGDLDIFNSCRKQP